MSILSDHCDVCGKIEIEILHVKTWPNEPGRKSIFYCCDCYCKEGYEPRPNHAGCRKYMG